MSDEKWVFDLDDEMKISIERWTARRHMANLDHIFPTEEGAWRGALAHVTAERDRYAKSVNAARRKLRQIAER